MAGRPQSGRNLFFRIRVGVLLVILAGVLLWAWRDVRSRHQRNTWKRPVDVAFILVRRGPVEMEAVDAFRDRIAALDDRLAEERLRYAGDGDRDATPPPHAFAFTFVGPVDVDQGPPALAGDGWIDAARESWALWRWTSRVDRIAGFNRGPYDSCIYVVARPPAHGGREMIEGESEEGGRVGFVEVELDASMADFALFVAAHEFFHTLGATDKYDAAGGTLIPSGLAEPDRVPRFPQLRAEVMARNRVIAPGIEAPPDTLDELSVGPATAREIGWGRSL